MDYLIWPRSLSVGDIIVVADSRGSYYLAEILSLDIHLLPSANTFLICYFGWLCGARENRFIDRGNNFVFVPQEFIDVVRKRPEHIIPHPTMEIRGSTRWFVVYSADKQPPWKTLVETLKTKMHDLQIMPQILFTQMNNTMISELLENKKNISNYLLTVEILFINEQIFY